MEPVRVLLSMVPFPSGPLGWKLDKSAVRWLGYSLMSAKYAKQNGIKDESQCLLLVTKGCKSGEKRTVALTYFNVAGRLLVVGSKGGAPADPAWVNNLRADPKATIYIKRRKRNVTARIAAGEERAALWGELSEKVPTYAHFQQQISREIPLVIFD